VSRAPAKPTQAELLAAKDKRLRDLVGPDLKVLFVGINPSLYSAAVGFHFARPGNRFWPTLHGAGFTERLLVAAEQHELLALGYGITNLVARATARADELAAEEFVRGAKALARKVRRLDVQNVAILGVSAYNLAYGKKQTLIGVQAEHQIGEATVWVLPNPSGLNAHYQLPELVNLYRQLLEAT
jgi:TDG/mug DNA glycosylase family protein